MKANVACIFLLTLACLPASAQRGNGRNFARGTAASTSRNFSRMGRVYTTPHFAPGNPGRPVIIINRRVGGWYGWGWSPAYYPALYPAYWNGWVGYRLSFSREKKSGLKLDLSSIREKTAQRYAEDGVVAIQENGVWANIGSVQLLAKKMYPLEPGIYDVKINFPDGRELTMTVDVHDHFVTKAPLTFSQPVQQRPGAQPQLYQPPAPVPAPLPPPIQSKPTPVTLLMVADKIGQ